MDTSDKNIFFRYEPKILTAMTRKRLISFFIATGLMLCCGCDRYLDLYPHYGVSKENVTEEDAQLLMTGIYNIAQYKPTFNGWALFDIIGGDIIRTGGSGVNSPTLLIHESIAPNLSIVTSPWNGFYAGVYQINYYIKAIETLPASKKKNEMLGVGHFFRGLYYYNIVSRWRNVPIVTSTSMVDIGQTDEAEAWKFVVSELEAAVELAANFTTKNYVSRQAAKGLLARTYLAMGQKEKAAELAEEVINDPQFALADFEHIFRGVANREEIFSFANLVEESSVNMSSYYYSKESPVGGSYVFCPTDEAMTMFSYSDKRRSVSVDVQNSNNVLNKYCCGDAGHDPIYIVRLGEMYLISAEGKGLAGGGLERLNELRRFRGLGDAAPTTEEEFLDAVLEERRMELFGEGFRWFDLVRTGKYEATVGVESKYTVMPVPSRELILNKLLEQHPLWKSSLTEEGEE